MAVIASGLAMDALAVSISSGFSIKSLKVGQALKIGVFFGSFQAIMPLIGWFTGLTFRDLIAHVDHWIAFGLDEGKRDLYQHRARGGGARGRDDRGLAAAARPLCAARRDLSRAARGGLAALHAAQRGADAAHCRVNGRRVPADGALCGARVGALPQGRATRVGDHTGGGGQAGVMCAGV